MTTTMYCHSIALSAATNTAETAYTAGSLSIVYASFSSDIRRRIVVPCAAFLGLLALDMLIELRDGTNGHHKRTSLWASD